LPENVDNTALCFYNPHPDHRSYHEIHRRRLSMR